jgi:hypothetical protein
MTLIEVVGGLGLLATVLVGMLLAKGRFTRQAAIADRRLQAVSAANTLLSGWRQNPLSRARQGGGDVPGSAQKGLRTGPVLNPQASEWEAQVIRLEMIDERPDNAGAVLTSVEFLVDTKPAENRPDKATAPPAKAAKTPNRPKHSSSSARPSK